MERIKYIVNLLIVALLLAAVAIGRDGRIVGESVDELVAPTVEESSEGVESRLSGGVIAFNSAPIAKDIVGYGGRTPVTLYTKDGRIERVEVAANDETPSFFDEVVASGLLKRWDGMSLDEAALQSVDAVSGATFTSVSIIRNVQRVAQYGAAVESVAESPFSGLGVKDILALLTILTGVVITFVRPKRKVFEVVQMALNIAVLGFWCGSFVSLSLLVSWLSNGVNLSMSAVVVALLLAAIVPTLFGRKGSYCYMHCPMGSVQELAWRLPITKLKINPAIVQWLNKLRYYILYLLLFMMWLGVGFELMDYEVFSAFLGSSASTFVLVMATVVLLLSIFVHRPYCRFVCPTGALLTISQRTKA